jgi:hypothetical protein
LDDDDSDPEDAPEPLANPPPYHKLLTYHYDTLNDLADDLHDWAAQALFGVRKARSANPIKGFGYSRIDFVCMKDKIRPTESITRKATSTAKSDCGWMATAKALASNNRKWTLEIRAGCEDHNHPPAESREAIATLRKFNAEHKAFVASFLDRPAVTARQIAAALRERFPGILFTRKQLWTLRHRLRRDDRDGYNPFQSIMKNFDDQDITHRVLWSKEDQHKPEGLVWTDTFCKEQWVLNP